MSDAASSIPNTRLSLLFSPGFLSGLGLLLFNDLLFKQIFHNWVTGKLSDFAGLFIFPLFLVALCPQLKRLGYLITGILFILWKSPVVQPLLDWWNHHAFITVSRVEDVTDTGALLVLPLSYLYQSRVPNKEVRRLLVSFICLLSIFAFTATSFSRIERSYSHEYQFSVSQAELTDKIERLSKIEITGDVKGPHRTMPSTYEIWFHSNAVALSGAIIVVSENKGRAKVSLIKIRGPGPGQPRAEEWRLYFEKEFIEPLKQNTVLASPTIGRIWLQTP